MTPIVDLHTHTRYSDGQAEVEDNVRAAIAAGCRVMVASDHLTLPEHMDPGSVVGVAESELTNLRADVERSRAAHPGIELILGFECDWYEGCEENVRKWSEGAEFRLGSVHYVTGQWMDDPTDMGIYREIGADEVWRRYVDAWCRACESELDFDTMAHPDLAMRFRNEGWPATIDLAPLYDRMAECAHDTHRRVEVNTAGLRKTVGGFYPAPELLRRFREAEVPITVGSDGHMPADICWGIRDAYAYAHAAGYRRIEVPHRSGEWDSWEIG